MKNTKTLCSDLGTAAVAVGMGNKSSSTVALEKEQIENLKSFIEEVKEHDSIKTLKTDILFDIGKKEWENYSLKRKMYRNRILYDIYKICVGDTIRNDIRILQEYGDYSILIKLGKDVRFVFNVSDDFELIYKIEENGKDITGWKIAYIDKSNITYDELVSLVVTEMKNNLSANSIAAIERKALKPSLEFHDFLNFENKIMKDLKI